MAESEDSGDGVKKGDGVCFVPVDHCFLVPEKYVKTVADMALWEKSEAYMEYTGFIATLNEAIKGKPLSVKCKVPDYVMKLVKMLDKIDLLINDFPPVEQPQRFGNVAFRDWLAKLIESAEMLLEDALDPKLWGAIPEIRVYFEESFGNPTRIDYGTGHEMSFIMFLCCLFKIEALKSGDSLAAVFKIFDKYIKIARKLQKTYNMEPAGSHGVWSLDDYQFVPFIWGSSQLVNQPVIYPPAKFVDEDILEKFSHEYMFLASIEHIKEVKKGPFAEHSNQLWSISAVSSWSKINQGLMKMYRKEVLGKFPVIQHVKFGSLLPIRRFPLTR